ncbi:unnamed protein product [marine sediment metagenome]|uniref:Uncharacterized protein n=1 Tax=marine sediment metagenome TaxID=412755 RepID=X1AL65_9ZZZZ
MHIPQECIYEVEAAMEQWTDKRIIDDVDLTSVLLFLLYVPKVLSQFGTTVKGFTCRQKNGQTLLTVKGWEGETPLVVFVTSGTPVGCMTRFLDLLEDDRLTWSKDRYPWI